MNLIDCPVCRRTISKDAERCPNCGHPIKKKESNGCLIFIGIMFILGGLFWWPGMVIGILIFIWAAVSKQ